MTDAATEGPKLDMGAVVRQTLAVTGRNIMPFLAISAVVGAVPDTLLEAAKVTWGTETDAALWNAMSRILGAITGVIVQGALVQLTLDDLAGRPRRAMAALRIGASRWGSIFGANFLSGVGVLLGVLLLIVPGLLLAARWSVIIPVVLSEGRNSSASLTRSQALTKGSLWRIVALTLILLAATIAAILVLSFLGGLAGGFISDSAPDLIATFLAGAVVSVFLYPAAAVLYVELRRMREGAAPGALAAVFD